MLDAEQAISRALDQVEALYAEVAATIREVADPDRAFRLATDFAARARAIHDEQETKLRKLRADQALRIKESKSLSLGGLATRLSISKTRADQLVRDAQEELP
jgi:hypothetical protein